MVNSIKNNNFDQMNNIAKDQKNSNSDKPFINLKLNKKTNDNNEQFLIKFDDKSNSPIFNENQAIEKLNLENNSKENTFIKKKTSIISSNVTNFVEGEMNSFNYENAIKYDKRTYFQYYISLLKEKQLIFFAFCPYKDYNLRTMKILLFIHSFSLYLTVSSFFFTDATMERISEEKGRYNLLGELPKIVYSFLIINLINLILKNLALSEKNILTIKKSKNIEESYKKSKNILKRIKIKFTIFFIFSFCLLLFYWYFISCFCTIYRNTQIILIINTIISFLISMLYPFGINLFPGFFRIYAISDKKKNRKCIFTIGKIISIF